MAAELSRQKKPPSGSIGGMSGKIPVSGATIVPLHPDGVTETNETLSTSEDEDLFTAPTTTQFVFTVPSYQPIGTQTSGPSFFSGLNFNDPETTIAAATIEPPKPDKRSTMSDPSREEIDAKLDVISAQTDAKFERIMGEMRTANASIIGHLNNLGTQVQAAKDAATEAKVAAQFTRWQIFFWVLGAFAAVIAVAALVHSNTQSVTALVQTAIAAKH